MGGELLITVAKWSCYIGFPGMLLWATTRIPSLMYKAKRAWWGGKAIRLFYVAENGKISTWLCKVGIDESPDVIQEDRKAFIYSKEEVLQLPDKIGRFSKEKFLWYSYDNIVPMNMKDGTKGMAYKPIKPEHRKMQKTPDEFYAALHTKVFKDAMQPQETLLNSKTGLVLLIVGLGVLYLIAKKAGWV